MEHKMKEKNNKCLAWWQARDELGKRGINNG